jgi:osmoprotectant transport system permease protein
MLVINVSAATMGAVVAAGGLGMPILAGFHDYNNAFIVEGALPAVALALLLDRALAAPRGTASPVADR